MNLKKIGYVGECLAAELLERKGYRVLNRNYRCTYGEIDIIAASGRTIAFVEVKTRLTDGYGEGRRAVDAGKRKRIKAAAGYYLTHSSTDFEDVDFQVVEIQLAHMTDLEF